MSEEEEGLPVKSPSGATYLVLSEEEVDFYENNKTEYLEHNSFTNMSDLQELDRILIFELQCWRWSNWLSLEHDWWNEPIDKVQLRKGISEYNNEIQKIKKSLGIDKSSRDKDKGSSLADYIEWLGRRAREFGYHRETQFEKIMILFNELMALVTFHNNCDESERKEFHCTEGDIIKWIKDVAIPEYEEIDRYFKEHHQRMWIKDV